METLINNVKKVEDDTDASFDYIAQFGQNPEEKTVTILLGPTGSGKTTLYYALTGKALKGMKLGRKKYLDAEEPNDMFQIGHDVMSRTYKPGLIFDPDVDIIFCDCPGFFDNRGDIQDITNSFAIYRVLKSAQNVKILFVVSYSDVSSTRGDPFRKSCKILEELIPSRPSLQPAISLIITKVPPSYLPQNSGDRLTLLDSVFTGDSWLMKYFKDSTQGSSNQKVVFTFPCPENDTQGQTYTGFTDRNNILDFIKNSPPTKILPFIALSKPAKLMIIDNICCFGSLTDLLSDFVRIITGDYLESDDNLDTWKKRIDDLCSTTFSSPKDFADKAREIVSTERYIPLYENFEKIDSWRSFLKRIAVEEYDTEEKANQIISQNSELLRPVFLDISKYLDEILTPHHSILLDKIEKRNIERKRKQTIEELRRLAELNEQILKEQEIQRKLAIEREHKLRLEWEERRKQRELQRIQNSSSGGGGGGGCLII